MNVAPNLVRSALWQVRVILALCLVSVCVTVSSCWRDGGSTIVIHIVAPDSFEGIARFENDDDVSVAADGVVRTRIEASLDGQLARAVLPTPDPLQEWHKVQVVTNDGSAIPSAAEASGGDVRAFKVTTFLNEHAYIIIDQRSEISDHERELVRQVFGSEAVR